MTYLIAFGGRPKNGPQFLEKFRAAVAVTGNEVTAALLTDGPGCCNLGFTLERPDEQLVNLITMALMPAKWSTTPDQLREGRFEVNLSEAN